MGELVRLDVADARIVTDELARPPLLARRKPTINSSGTAAFAGGAPAVVPGPRRAGAHKRDPESQPAQPRQVARFYSSRTFALRFADERLSRLGENTSVNRGGTR